jgi:hypothetical protein
LLALGAGATFDHVFRLIRFLFSLSLLVAFVWFGATVPLGKHTLFGHLKAIWNSQEAHDMVQGTKESAGPAIDKVKRGVKAGVDEAGK